MIGYPVGVQRLRGLVKQEKSTWPGRAQSRQKGFRQAGCFNEDSHIWSEVKGVFMRLQNEKCGFCERRLTDEEHGKVEHDVEHFRPDGVGAVAAHVEESRGVLDERALAGRDARWQGLRGAEPSRCCEHREQEQPGEVG